MFYMLLLVNHRKKCSKYFIFIKNQVLDKNKQVYIIINQEIRMSVILNFNFVICFKPSNKFFYTFF